ncbi:MAG: hypothetical protein ACLFPJ_03110 [Candidatus Woesearchaeota archaeon]
MKKIKKNKKIKKSKKVNKIDKNNSTDKIMFILLIIFISFIVLYFAIDYFKNYSNSKSNLNSEIDLNLTNPDYMNPVSFPEKLVIRGNKRNDCINTIFYNNYNSTLYNIDVRITNCTNFNNIQLENPTMYTKFVEELEMDSIVAFTFGLDLTNLSYDKGKYNCFIEMYDAENPTEIYESKKFVMQVI